MKRVPGSGYYASPVETMTSLLKSLGGLIEHSKTAQEAIIISSVTSSTVVLGRISKFLIIMLHFSIETMARMLKHHCDLVQFLQSGPIHSWAGRKARNAPIGRLVYFDFLRTGTRK